MRRCAGCGADAPQGTKFCRQCGTFLPDDNEPPVATWNQSVDVPPAIHVAPPVAPATVFAPVPGAASPRAAVPLDGAWPPAASPHEAPRGRGRTILLVALVSVLAIAVGAGAVLLLGRKKDTTNDAAVRRSAASSTSAPTGSSSAPAPGVPTTSSSAVPDRTVAPPASAGPAVAPSLAPTLATVSAPTTTVPVTTTVLPTTTVDPDTAAYNQVARLVVADKPRVDAVLNRWVPQLSAKQLGIVAEGVTYTWPAILQDHATRRAAYGAALVYADTYNFGTRLHDWYVTIVPEGFDDAQGALGWCRSHSIDRNNCFAKLLRGPGDDTGTVVLQK